MKTGKSLVELATEIQRRAENKQDLVVNSANLELVASSQDERAGAALVELPRKDWSRMVALAS